MSNNEFKQVESRWIGRSLSNYKAQHRGTAERKGVETQFQKAQTLTAAKKILFGHKKGNALLRK
jgi:hypothetical protein